MEQDNASDLAAPQAGKVAPEAVTLRAQPRPVTRLNRRMLAVLVGGVATAVLGATIWSLQAPQRRGAGEQTELYNVDRVSHSEGLAQLPADYSQLSPALPPDVPMLGEPLPGDLGAPILRAEQRAQGYQQPGHDPAEAERLRSPRTRPSTRWRPGRPRRPHSRPNPPPCRTGRSRRRRFCHKPVPRKPVIPAICNCPRRRIR